MKNLLKGKTISLVASGLILSSSLSFGADSLESAFKEGTTSGSLTAYTIKSDNKGGEKDSGFTNGNVTIGYETASYMGLSAKAEFKGNLKIDELENGNYDDTTDSPFQNNSLMTEAYVKYAMDGFSLSAGRQAIDLEWLGDYNESVVAAITAVPNTTIVLGYTDRQAASDETESGDFSEVTKKGAYVLDVKYTGLEGFEFNPYAYSAPDVANFYGLKATYTSDMFGAIAQYAASNEDVSTQKDGSIAHLELSGTLAGVTAKAGYIKTDKDAGTASISAYGDNISPFDNGANTYEKDAQTVYASLDYSIAGVDLGVLYGETDFDVNSEEKELNVTAGYSINDNLSVSLLYVDYDLEKSADNDFKSLSATVAYTF